MKYVKSSLVMAMVAMFGTVAEAADITVNDLSISQTTNIVMTQKSKEWCCQVASGSEALVEANTVVNFDKSCTLSIKAINLTGDGEAVVNVYPTATVPEVGEPAYVIHVTTYADPLPSGTTRKEINAGKTEYFYVDIPYSACTLQPRRDSFLNYCSTNKVQATDGNTLVAVTVNYAHEHSQGAEATDLQLYISNNGSTYSRRTLTIGAFPPVAETVRLPIGGSVTNLLEYTRDGGRWWRYANDNDTVASVTFYTDAACTAAAAMDATETTTTAEQLTQVYAKVVGTAAGRSNVTLSRVKSSATTTTASNITSQRVLDLIVGCTESGTLDIELMGEPKTVQHDTPETVADGEWKVSSFDESIATVTTEALPTDAKATLNITAHKEGTTEVYASNGLLEYTLTVTVKWCLVDVVPATVANATAKVYTNGVEVTGSPLQVVKGSTVKFVYTAADGYAFDITGKTTVETTLTADANPLEDTTTTAMTFLKVAKYETYNSTEKKYVTYYLPSLKAAVEKAAADGDAEFYPELLANSEGDGIYIPEGTFSDGYVFEFGGYSYTITNAVKATGTSGTDGFYLGSSGGFRGPGTISCTADSGVKTLVNNRGDLSLGGLTLDGTNMHKAGEKCIVLSNSCTDQGYATLDEANLIAAEGDVALDTCTVGGANAPFVTLLFSNGTVINGDIELKGGNVEIRGENAGTAKLVDAGIGDGIIKRWNSTIAAPTAYYWAPGEEPWEILKKLYEVKPATADGLTVKVYTNGAEVAGPRYYVLPNSLVTNIYATTDTYYFTNGTRTATTELTVATDPTQDTVMDVWNSGWHCVDDYEGNDTEKIYQAALADGFSTNIATRLSRSGVKGYEHFCKWANVGVKGQQYALENLWNATNLLLKAAYQQPWDRNLADLDDNPWYQSPWFQYPEILFDAHYDKEKKDWVVDFTYFWTTNYVDETYGETKGLYGFWKLYGSMTLLNDYTTSDELFRESVGCKSALNGSSVMTETSGVARVISADSYHDNFEVIFIPKWDPEKEEPPKSFIATPIFY